LVYDITRKSSFKALQKWLIELKQYAEPDCLISLVGNKLDLVEKDEDKREVPYQEAKNFADENKLFFIETSALVNLQVNEAFENLIEGKHCKFIEKYTKLNK
jgi:GTPase SAR1 family protein